MPIGSDFTIDYANKAVRHSSGTTVYTVRQLYSWLMDSFDELAQMDDTVPMSAQTNTAFTMINGWWLDIGQGSYAHKYLSGGAISTSGYNGAIRLLKLETGSWHTLTAGDLGKVVAYVGDSPADTGTCIGYDNTLKYIWVRTTASFSNTSTAIKVDGDASSSLLDSGGTLTGEELFGNVYTVGTIETTPQSQVYIYQNGSRIAEWSSLTNWDRTGHIDVVLQVKEMGVEIDSRQVTVFARQMGDTFDHFTATLTDAGQNVAPLSTGLDLNDAGSDYYLLYNSEAGGGFAAATVVVGATSGAYAEIVSVTDWGSEGLLALRGVNGTFQNAENLQVGGATKGVANGTAGDTYLTYSTETGTFTTGLVVTGGTSGAKRILRGLQDDGATGKMVLQVSTSDTGTARTPYFKAFSSGEIITDTSTGSATTAAASTTVTSGFTDITVAFVNGTVTHGGTSGTFTPGERVTYTGGEAIVLKDSGGVLTLGNVTNTTINTKVITGDKSTASCTASSDLSSSHTMLKAFTQQSSYSYDVIVECGSIYNTGRALTDVYKYLKFLCRDGSSFDMYTVVATTITILDGEEYIRAFTGYNPSKQAPFGTLAGVTVYGAQSVWLEGMASSDANNLQLTDSSGTVRTPYTSIVVQITNTVSGDSISVLLDDGSGAVDKDTYTAASSGNNLGDNELVIQEAIPTDTPATGVVRIVDVSIPGEEYRIRYGSWTGSTFTFVTAVSGSATGGGTGTDLDNSGASFLSNDIKYGDIVRNITDGSYAYVVSVDGNTQITTTSLTGGGDNTWTSGDDYAFHTLPRALVGTDTVYVPYIDDRATGTSISKTILYSANRNVIIRGRNAGNILPFQTTGTINTGGLNVSLIRNPDSIYQ